MSPDTENPSQRCRRYGGYYSSASLNVTPEVLDHTAIETARWQGGLGQGGTDTPRRHGETSRFLFDGGGFPVKFNNLDGAIAQSVSAGTSV